APEPAAQAVRVRAPAVLLAGTHRRTHRGGRSGTDAHQDVLRYHLVQAARPAPRVHGRAVAGLVPDPLADPALPPVPVRVLSRAGGTSLGSPSACILAVAGGPAEELRSRSPATGAYRDDVMNDETDTRDEAI